MKTIALVIGMMLVGGAAQAAECTSWSEVGGPQEAVEDLESCIDYKVDTCAYGGAEVPVLRCYDRGDDTHDFVSYYSFVPFGPVGYNGAPVMLVAF